MSDKSSNYELYSWLKFHEDREKNPFNPLTVLRGAVSISLQGTVKMRTGFALSFFASNGTMPIAFTLFGNPVTIDEKNQGLLHLRNCNYMEVTK